MPMPPDIARRVKGALCSITALAIAESKRIIRSCAPLQRDINTAICAAWKWTPPSQTIDGERIGHKQAASNCPSELCSSVAVRRLGTAAA